MFVIKNRAGVSRPDFICNIRNVCSCNMHTLDMPPLCMVRFRGRRDSYNSCSIPALYEADRRIFQLSDNSKYAPGNRGACPCDLDGKLV